MWDQLSDHIEHLDPPELLFFFFFDVMTPSVSQALIVAGEERRLWPKAGAREISFLTASMVWPESQGCACP